MRDNTLGIALIKCFFCGKDKGLVMNLRLHPAMASRIEEMNGTAIDKEPCEECKKLMEQGIMFCSVRDGEKGDNPYRTGKLCVIKEEAVKRMVDADLYNKLEKSRFAFIEDSVWEQIGLPKGENGVLS